MKVDVVRPSELGQPELSRWCHIQESHPNLGSPFLSPYFALAMERARGSTRVGVLSDSTGLVGFFPYEQRRFGSAAALAQGLSDVQGLIVPPAAEVDLREVLTRCRIRAWEFDHLLGHQAGLVNTGPCRFVEDRSPVIDLWNGFEIYEKQQRASSSSLFQSTARKRRKLEREHGPVQVVFQDEDPAHLHQVLRWKSAQYRRTGRRDRFSDPANLALVHDLFEVRQPAFSAPLTVLLAGDTVVAGHLGLRSTATLAWWFPAYDPNFGQYSPGLVMLLELARAMAAEGLSVLDLGKGDEPYKERLRNRELPLLKGMAAPRRATTVINRARDWPRDRVNRLVLESPRLRSWARQALHHFGALRERVVAGDSRG